MQSRLQIHPYNNPATLLQCYTRLVSECPKTYPTVLWRPCNNTWVSPEGKICFSLPFEPNPNEDLCNNRNKLTTVAISILRRLSPSFDSPLTPPRRIPVRLFHSHALCSVNWCLVMCNCRWTLNNPSPLPFHTHSDMGRARRSSTTNRQDIGTACKDQFSRPNKEYIVVCTGKLEYMNIWYESSRLSQPRLYGRVHSH
jgi:hypothetical protein